MAFAWKVLKYYVESPHLVSTNGQNSVGCQPGGFEMNKLEYYLQSMCEMEAWGRRVLSPPVNYCNNSASLP